MYTALGDSELRVDRENENKNWRSESRCRCGIWDNLGCSSKARGFPGGSAGKESACNAGDLGSIPGLGRSAGEGHGNPLQYCCLENLMERRPWWATAHGVTKSWTWLSDITIPRSTWGSALGKLPEVAVFVFRTRSSSDAPSCFTELSTGTCAQLGCD